MRKTLAALGLFLAATAWGQPNVIRHPPVYTYATAPACAAGETRLYALSDSGACDSDDAGSGVICQCVDGTVTEVGAGGGAASDSFKTINAPAGTDPVADSSTDTLNITCAGGLTCTGDSATDTIDFTVGNITGNAATATALAADPADCAANQFANAIAASGALTCAGIADADVPDTITITLAATATALAANGTNCDVGQYARGMDASGNAESCTADDTGTDDQTASEVVYTPTTGTDWTDPDPASVGEGLDDLAARLTVEEAKADDDVPESGDFGNAVDLEADGSLSADVVAAAEMADADHGDVSWSGGVATVDSGAVGLTEIADDATCTGGQTVRRNAGDTAYECYTPSASGDVVGPASSTDFGIPYFDDTTGKLLGSSTATVTADGILTASQVKGDVVVGITADLGGSAFYNTIGAIISGNRALYFTSGNFGTSPRNTSIWRQSDGVVQISGSSSSTIGSIVASRLVEASTAGSGAPNVLTATESNKVFTNEGATAKSYQTLPSAVAGLYFPEFVVADADGLRVTAAAGDVIHLSNGQTSTAGGYCESTTQWTSTSAQAINATDWYGKVSGTGWTCDGP